MLPDATLQTDFTALTDLENHRNNFTIRVNGLLMKILLKKMSDLQINGPGPNQKNHLKKMYTYDYDISIRVLSSKFYIEI
jgi:hypothetical protein